MRFLATLATLGAGILFLRLAWKAYAKDWKLVTSVCVVAALLCLFGSLPWAQGFFKTAVLKELRAYGTRLDGFQRTITDMADEISCQQKQIVVQQKAISNQQKSLVVAQASILVHQNRIETQHANVKTNQDAVERQQLAVADLQKKLLLSQSELLEQQKKLEDVETLTNNLFLRSRAERFALSDTNRVWRIRHGSKAHWIVFKLNEYAVKGSVQGYYGANGNTPMKPLTFHSGNIVYAIFVGSLTELFKNEFWLTYVADPDNMNYINRIEVRDDKIYVDGIYLPLRPE